MYDSETFRREATQFNEISKSLNANWQLRFYVESEADSLYLVLKEEKCARKRGKRESREGEDERIKIEGESGETDNLDSQFFMPFEDAGELDLTEKREISTDGSEKQLLSFEYHVLYSSSYSVPALYFKVHGSNGKALRLEEFWEIVPESFLDATSTDSKWKFVTEQEHSYLGKPFFHLHPCRTAEAMRAIRKDTADYPFLLSWFSCYGPFANLYLPNEFYTKSL